jgi:hypothetical protein
MQDQQSKYPVLQTSYRNGFQGAKLFQAEVDDDAPFYDVAKCQKQIAHCITITKKYHLMPEKCEASLIT